MSPRRRKLGVLLLGLAAAFAVILSGMSAAVVEVTLDPQLARVTVLGTHTVFSGVDQGRWVDLAAFAAHWHVGGFLAAAILVFWAGYWWPYWMGFWRGLLASAIALIAGRLLYAAGVVIMTRYGLPRDGMEWLHTAISTWLDLFDWVYSVSIATT